MAVGVCLSLCLGGGSRGSTGLVEGVAGMGVCTGVGEDIVVGTTGSTGMDVGVGVGAWVGVGLAGLAVRSNTTGLFWGTRAVPYDSTMFLIYPSTARPDCVRVKSLMTLRTLAREMALPWIFHI